MMKAETWQFLCSDPGLSFYSVEWDNLKSYMWFLYSSVDSLVISGNCRAQQYYSCAEHSYQTLVLACKHLLDVFSTQVEVRTTATSMLYPGLSQESSSIYELLGDFSSRAEMQYTSTPFYSCCEMLSIWENQIISVALQVVFTTCFHM